MQRVAEMSTSLRESINEIGESLPQRLKPPAGWLSTARLNPCPDTKRDDERRVLIRIARLKVVRLQNN